MEVAAEGVGDVFEEDEAEDEVLAFRRVHVVAKLIGGEPELRLEADGGGGGLFYAVGFSAGHGAMWISAIRLCGDRRRSG